MAIKTIKASQMIKSSYKRFFNKLLKNKQNSNENCNVDIIVSREAWSNWLQSFSETIHFQNLGNVLILILISNIGRRLNTFKGLKVQFDLIDLSTWLVVRYIVIFVYPVLESVLIE